MDFPIADLMDQDACYHELVGWLHPDGPACPDCKTDAHARVHRRHRAPVLDYRCTACGRVFNAFTATALAGTHRTPAEIVLILRGFAQGVPTAQLARVLGCDRKHLLELRHSMQDDADRWLDRNPLGDAVVEADEMYQNAGEKGGEHADPDDPPRYRANKRRGHGTFANNRPPVAGMVGRELGEVRLEVVDSAGAEELDEFVDRSYLSDQFFSGLLDRILEINRPAKLFPSQISLRRTNRTTRMGWQAAFSLGLSRSQRSRSYRWTRGQCANGWPENPDQSIRWPRRR